MIVMRKLWGVMLLLTLSCSALATPKIITISKLEYGQTWPFTKEEVMLQCRPVHALFVINTSTLAQYPLNEAALTQAKSGQVNAQPLKTILLPGREDMLTLKPIQQRALSLCSDN